MAMEHDGGAPMTMLVVCSQKVSPNWNIILFNIISIADIIVFFGKLMQYGDVRRKWVIVVMTWAGLMLVYIDTASIVNSEQ